MTPWHQRYRAILSPGLTALFISNTRLTVQDNLFHSKTISQTARGVLKLCNYTKLKPWDCCRQVLCRKSKTMKFKQKNSHIAPIPGVWVVLLTKSIVPVCIVPAVLNTKIVIIINNLRFLFKNVTYTISNILCLKSLVIVNIFFIKYKTICHTKFLQ